MPCRFPRIALLFMLAAACASAQQNPAGLDRAGNGRVRDAMVPLPPADARMLDGMLGKRIAASVAARLVNVNEDDLLTAFESRSAATQSWQGEHVGKFLHAASLAWANTGNAELRAKLDRVVGRLVRTQEADGYLGTYPPQKRWTQWDVWVHKYCMLGLLAYWQYAHAAPRSAGFEPGLAAKALKAAERAADLLVATFGPGGRNLNRSGEHDGLAPDSVLEPIVLLYRATGNERYLAFANRIVAGYDGDGGPGLVTRLLRTGSVRDVGDAKAYEMLSCLNGLLELYRVEGNRSWLRAAEAAWADIVAHHLYITGSASSYEVFPPNGALPPDEASNICETCVSVTWEQFNLQLLRLTGNARYADEIERTAYNHLAAAQRPNGDAWCYYTPLEGHKPYSSTTSCCLSSGPRGLELLPSAAFLATANGAVVVNLYEPALVQAEPPSGTVKLRVSGNWPFEPSAFITVDPHWNPQHFAMLLRIPAWANGATWYVNGDRPQHAPPGAYVRIERDWRRGDRVTINTPLNVREVRGTGTEAGRTAVMAGPLVLAADTASNPGLAQPDQVGIGAAAEVRTLDRGPEGAYSAPAGALGAGEHVVLTPFADAGADGTSRYSVWLTTASSTEAPASAGVHQVEAPPPIAPPVTSPGAPIPPAGPPAARTAPSGSVLFHAAARASRAGRHSGSFVDDDRTTWTDTNDGTDVAEDWFEARLPYALTIDRIVFMHGHAAEDGGWFDTSGGKPRVQVLRAPDGVWTTVATLEAYPDTTATSPGSLVDGAAFEIRLPPTVAIAVRVAGAPAHGTGSHGYSSCAELQAFAYKSTAGRR